MSPVTRGPVVNESLETNLPGVFACGNVLHVHDLVDFVSEEAGIAGRNAAEYVKTGRGAGKESGIPVIAKDGVRYTVPSSIRPEFMNDRLVIRFRVGGVYRNCYISAYIGSERKIHKKCRIVAPGEMQQVILQKKDIEAAGSVENVTVCLEQE